MSILTEPLKFSVTVGGESYPVNTDFKCWLRIAELICTENPEPENIVRGLILCYRDGRIPPSFRLAVEGMKDFFGGIDGRESAGEHGKKLMDFEKDAQLIFASFMYDYGIDLTSTDMHWHKFLALLRCLSEASPLSRVVQIRGTDAYSIKDSKRRQAVLECQRAFALEKPDFADELDRVM